MAVALIVAAGSGERLGARVPKALVPVGGRPLLEWSLEALAAVPEVTAVVVALPPSALDYPLAPGVIGVPGGAVRSGSVLAALEAAPAGDPILVHDAARPLAPAQLFSAVLHRLESTEVDAVIPASAVTDTIKVVEAEGRRVIETLDRSRLVAVQTPQGFRRAMLERVLHGSPEELAAATDDASLIERAGGRVEYLPVPLPNFKITTQLDLALAELLLSER